MPGNKRILVSWGIGVLLLLLLFYAAGAWLRLVVRSSAASELEKQIGVVLASDIAEGNLFKLGASLERLRHAGSLEYAEVRIFSRARGWEPVFRTSGRKIGAAKDFDGFSCGQLLHFRAGNGPGLGLITTLQSHIEGADCAALMVESDLSPDLKAFWRRLMIGFAVLLTGILLFYLRLTVSWHKRELEIEVKAKTAEAEKEAAIGRIAAQVAHDIRSPLAALESALSDAEAIPGERGELVRSALGRISGIAGGLLENYRGRVPVSIQDLHPSLESVIREKRAHYLARPGLKLDFFGREKEVYSAINAMELQRIISNLVNNAAESIEKDGRILVELNSADKNAVIRITDNGRGIPGEVLSKLGQKGETHGKADGTGLGLYHARITVESWGGGLAIESAAGKGTVVVVSLPLVARTSERQVALIDDDPLVRLNWTAAARAKGVGLRVFASPEEFFKLDIPKDAAVYIDSDLGGGVKGEEVAVALKEKGFSDVTLETGHPPDKFAAIKWLKVQGKEPPF